MTINCILPIPEKFKVPQPEAKRDEREQVSPEIRKVAPSACSKLHPVSVAFMTSEDEAALVEASRHLKWNQPKVSNPAGGHPIVAETMPADQRDIGQVAEDAAITDALITASLIDQLAKHEGVSVEYLEHRIEEYKKKHKD